MSSGAKIKLYACEETVLGQTPASPVWNTIRRVSDSLSENVSSEQSNEIVDTRFRQGGIATEAEITGTLEVELSLGTFDMFFSALACNDWVANILNFGGNVRKSFTIVKVFEDVGQVFIYRGVQVSTGELTINTTGKITGNFGLVGTSFTRQTVNPVTAPVAASSRPLVSALNVANLLVNGQSIQGVACLQTLTLSFNNNVEGVRCIGSGKLTPEKHIEKIMDIDLTASFMFSGVSAAYIDNIKSRAKMTLAFEINDSQNSKYTFNFPQLEVMEAGHPDGGLEDLVTQDVSFAHVKVSPTITRALI